MKKILTTLAAVLALTGIISFFVWYQDSLQPLNTSHSGKLYVEIRPGMSSAEIAELLEVKEIIKDDLAFRLHLRSKGLSGRLMAGFYALDYNQSAPAIAATLTEGKTATLAIQIPSGKTLNELTALMLKAGFKKADITRALTVHYNFSVLKDKPLHASLEGYLFPDTYHLGLNASAQDLVTMILANTEAKVTTEIRQAWLKKGLNIHEGLTLASIVQKEMPTPEEQQKAAQVFLKRLKLGIKLKADPTYIYAARQKGVIPTPELDSPYNTYLVAGLPPGPISNMEVSSIQAVATPASTNYLYFVTGKDGVTRFSRSEAEHLSLIEKYGLAGEN